MRKSLTFAFAWVICAGSASADHIGVYNDPLGYGCTLETPTVGPPGFSVYVVHRFNSGATASQFKVLDLIGLFATTQSTIGGISLGTWNTDWSIAYGACLAGDVHIATLNFFYFGTPLPLLCTDRLVIAPAPTAVPPGSVITLNCTEEADAATGGGTGFGPMWDLHAGSCYCGTLATQEATWGAVKALYR